ncbi:MAG TPA: PmoA family protein [Vicinamibacterales bacterium]|nr:PmoA family protein [Vicinamibacterales bacterium]HPW19398.1 PmoA family protein [Vicinamibacterales bacterium]
MKPTMPGGRASIAAVAAIAAAALASGAGQTGEKGVRLVRDDANRRVDVIVDGQPFTAYIYPAALKKPVLFPIRTANGTLVTRGFPLEPREGERVDHPHQVGLWFTYGDVNGVDFWNNSDAIKPEDRPKMGTIVHKGVAAVHSGADRGELETDMDWTLADGQVVLKEHTTFVFRGGAGWRSIDRVTRLQALDGRVSLRDNKEGMFGMRVARQLEIPSQKPEVFADAAGRPTSVAVMNNEGVNGDYLTSEGRTGDAAWGTRAKWCALSAKIGSEPVTIAILDHPANPGFPTYWHARGYGLFSANPLGQKDLSGGRETLDFALGPRESATFRYRVVIFSVPADAARIEAAHTEFVAAYR